MRNIAGFIHAKRRMRTSTPFDDGVLLLELTLRSAPDLLNKHCALCLCACAQNFNISFILMIVKARRPNGQYK